MQDKDQHVNLPDLGDEGQHGRDAGPDKIQPNQHGAAGKDLRDGAGDGRNGDICNHLDRKRRSENDPGVGAGEIVGKEGERHGGKARACEGDNLRSEKMAVCAVLQYGEHDLRRFPKILTGQAFARQHQ